jgi:hypothetical protein
MNSTHFLTTMLVTFPTPLTTVSCLHSNGYQIYSSPLLSTHHHAALLPSCHCSYFTVCTHSTTSSLHTNQNTSKNAPHASSLYIIIQHTSYTAHSTETDWKQNYLSDIYNEVSRLPQCEFSHMVLVDETGVISLLSFTR